MVKNKDQYKNIVNSLLLEHKIKVIRTRSTNTGRAYLRTREVEIPEPKNIQKFVTCIHEISHILYDRKSNPLWKSEFIATKYAEEFCVSNNIELPQSVVKHMKVYLKSCICKGLIRGLNIDKINEEILQYVDINKDDWKRRFESGYKPFVYRDTGNINWYKKSSF